MKSIREVVYALYMSGELSRSELDSKIECYKGNLDKITPYMKDAGIIDYEVRGRVTIYWLTEVGVKLSRIICEVNKNKLTNTIKTTLKFSFGGTANIDNLRKKMFKGGFPMTEFGIGIDYLEISGEIDKSDLIITMR